MSAASQTNAPRAQRPNLPASYGINPSAAGLLSWDFVDRRMGQARNY